MEHTQNDALRNLMKGYVKYNVPEVPARIPVIAIPSSHSADG